MKLKFKGLTCPGCRMCGEAVAYARDRAGNVLPLRLATLFVLALAVLAFIVGQYVIAFGCFAVCLALFNISLFATKMQYSHAVFREGISRRCVYHTHLYDPAENKRPRLVATRLVIDYRFGRVIACEQVAEGIVIEPKLVGSGIACQYPPHGERRVSSIRHTLMELAAYEPPRSA